jgi:hypothetical protein
MLVFVLELIEVHASSLGNLSVPCVFCFGLIDVPTPRGAVFEFLLVYLAATAFAIVIETTVHAVMEASQVGAMVFTIVISEQDGFATILAAELCSA